MPPYTTADVRRARALYASGHTLTEVAEAIGCARRTVHRWLGDEVRSPARARRRRLAHRLGMTPAEFTAAVLRLYERGMGIEHVADTLGVSRTPVRDVLDTAGALRTKREAMRLRYNDRRHPEARERIAKIREAAAMKASGTPIAEICARFGIEESTLYQWLRSEHNVLAEDAWRTYQRRAA